MKHENPPDALEQVRSARRQISEAFDHDPRKLVEHYMEMQRKYADRLVGREKKVQDKVA